MAGFVVVSKDERKGKYHLSVICPVELSVSETLNLDSFKKDMDCVVRGCSCGGLLYFYCSKGNNVICNLKTKEMKVLTPPKFLPPPNVGYLISSGMGYDAKSGDLKVIRNYVQHYSGEREKSGEKPYFGSKRHLELYSLKYDKWKEIDEPVGCVYSGVGVYVEGTRSCYWVTSVDPFFQEIKDYLKTCNVTDPYSRHVVSFDFATDCFNLFPLPALATTSGSGKSGDPRARFALFKYRGSLGALAYWKSSSYELSIKLFVREGTSWDVLYDDVPPLGDVERPLGLKDDRWLFVEAIAKASDGGQVIVYDLYTKESKKLNIYGYPGDMYGHMYGISYDAESTDPPLPDSIPITNYFLQGEEHQGEEDQGGGEEDDPDESSHWH